MNDRPELVRVGKRRQRVHLAPAPESAAHTLCGKVFEPGEFDLTDSEADCTFCVRNSHNPAVVSSAFFASGAGSALLELSLAAAPRRGSDRRAAASMAEETPTEKPRLRVMAGGRKHESTREPAAEPEPEPAAPPAPPGPPFPGLRFFSERVFISPARVIVRVDADGEIVEVVADATSVQLRSLGGRSVLVAGDVEVGIADGRLRGRLLQ